MLMMHDKVTVPSDSLSTAMSFSSSSSPGEIYIPADPGILRISLFKEVAANNNQLLEPEVITK